MGTLLGVVVTGIVASMLAVAASTGVTAIVSADPGSAEAKTSTPVYGGR